MARGARNSFEDGMRCGKSVSAHASSRKHFGSGANQCRCFEQCKTETGLLIGYDVPQLFIAGGQEKMAGLWASPLKRMLQKDVTKVELR
jgi:hypothetical protein